MDYGHNSLHLKYFLLVVPNLFIITISLSIFHFFKNNISLQQKKKNLSVLLVKDNISLQSISIVYLFFTHPGKWTQGVPPPLAISAHFSVSCWPICNPHNFVRPGGEVGRQPLRQDLCSQVLKL